MLKLLLHIFFILDVHYVHHSSRIPAHHNPFFTVSMETDVKIIILRWPKNLWSNITLTFRGKGGIISFLLG